MRIQINSTSFSLTHADRAYIEKKISPLERFLKRFEKYEEQTLLLEIVRPSRHHTQGNGFVVSGTLSLGKKQIHIEQFAEDFHIAVDLLSGRLKNDIQKHKEKIITKTIRERR